MIKTILLSMLVVSVFAGETGNSKSCQSYKNDIATKDGIKTSRAAIYWSDETFVADLKADSPKGQAVYDVKFLQRMPFIGTKLLMKGSLDTSLFQSDLRTISFEYDFSKKDNLIIKVYFRPKSQSHRWKIIEVSVFENDGDFEVKNNEKLYQYLQQINPEETVRVEHNLSWMKQTLHNVDGTPKEIYKLKEKKEWKLETYYTDCQYVPAGTLQNFASRFGWSENDSNQ